jgi:hypothetical protein
MGKSVEKNIERGIRRFAPHTTARAELTFGRDLRDDDEDVDDDDDDDDEVNNGVRRCLVRGFR